jgi:hypothetical protein
MNRRQENRHGFSLSKKHECVRQELRNEPTTEGLRLDGLKKALQARLRPDLKACKEVRAA